MTDVARKLPDTVIHDAKGRFAKGNPGRPKGAVAKHSRTLLAQVKAMGPDAIEKLREAVNDGQRWAIELILNHVLPGERTIEWNDLEPDDVREAVKQGDISVEEAAKLTTALEKLATIEGMEEIRTRLAELEEAIKDAR